MTKIKLFIIIGIISLLSNLRIDAQISHNILFWGNSGLSYLSTNTNLTPIGKLGVGLGAGYELHIGDFLLQTGAEVTYMNAGFKMKDFTRDSIGMIDNDVNTEYNTYTGHFKFINNQDTYNLFNANFPLMLGGKFGAFYFLAGGKIGLNLLGNSTTQTLVTSSATYNQLIGEFENMPTHGFYTNKNEKGNYQLSFKTNYSMSCEFGVYLGGAQVVKSNKKSETQCRLSFFCDYGINNIKNPSTGNLVLNNNGSNVVYEPVLNSFMLTSNYSNSSFQTFFSGVKFTILIGISKKGCECKWYKDYR